MSNPNPPAEAPERPASSQRASVGRIVHYREREGAAPQAAVVVAVPGKDRANLLVFDGGNGQISFIRSAEQGKGARQWSWPELT
jgi:hypothetical protein